MAVSTYPTVQYTSDRFVCSAGSILFRRSPTSQSPPSALEICILYHRGNTNWLLPKGRKDVGEPMSAAGVRETYEETGYPCELLPCRMPTRAPLPGTNTHDALAVVDDVTEPFMITMRDLGEGKTKMIWWFITRVTGEKVEGTQTATEQFDSHFLDADEALARLTFATDRDVVSAALKIVRETQEVPGTQILL